MTTHAFSPRVATFLVAALAAFPGLSAARNDRDALLARIQSTLLESRGSERTEEQVLEQLARLGEEAAPLYVELFAGSEALEAIFDVAGVDPVNVRWWGRPDRFGELAARVLVEHMPAAALETLAATHASNATLEDRLALFHLTARIGSAASFELWLDTALDLNDEESITHMVRVTLRKSLAKHLAARPENYELLGEALRKPRHPAFLDDLSRAIELDSDPRGILLLVSLLDADEDGLAVPPPSEIIPRLDALTRRFPWVLGDGWRARLTRYLVDDRRPVRYAATAALRGRSEALHDLQQVLENESDAQGAAIAQRALSRSFDLKITLSPTTLSRRVERELTWWENTGLDMAYGLVDLDLPAANAVLRELQEKHAFHARIAEIVAGELDTLSTNVARCALAFLVELDEPAAIPGLVRALTTAGPALRGSILKTLEALSGLQSGNDPAAWASLLAF